MSAPTRHVEDTPSDERFSLVAGGPFDALLDRLGFIGSDGLPTRTAAMALASLAWMLPALLALLQFLLDDRSSRLAFFTDTTVYARFLVASWVMIATERFADGRLVLLAREFREARVLPEVSLPLFRKALAAADRRSSSALAELVLLVLAVLWSSITTRYAVVLSGTSWEGTLVTGEVTFSWAGHASRFVSNPLFLFLLLRWAWRFLVWTGLLYRISRLPLQLTPLHPDRSAGLGFLTIYPSIFSGLVFALSCVIASSFLKDLHFEHHAPETVWFTLIAWIATCLLVFLGPLFVFARPLYLARERALLEYGRLANQHHLAFHRKWVVEGRAGETLMGSPDASSASDLNASLQSVQELRILPIDRVAVTQLVMAAGVPLLAVVARLIPLADVARFILGSLL